MISCWIAASVGETSADEEERVETTRAHQRDAQKTHSRHSDVCLLTVRGTPECLVLVERRGILALVRACRRVGLRDALRERAAFRVVRARCPGVRLAGAGRAEGAAGHHTGRHPELPRVDRVAWRRRQQHRYEVSANTSNRASRREQQCMHRPPSHDPHSCVPQHVRIWCAERYG